MDRRTLLKLAGVIAGAAATAYSAHEGSHAGSADLEKRVSTLEFKVQIILCKVAPESCLIPTPENTTAGRP